MGNTNRTQRVCLVPNVSGVGGMVSFRDRLVKGFTERGIEICHDLTDKPYDGVLVIGGTRQLAELWGIRRQGVSVVQRLDGMNWIHRRRRTGWRHFLRAEYGNLVLSIIRSRLADGIVYQSGFSQQWWERIYGTTKVPWKVVHNGVDLDQYSPHGQTNLPGDHVRMLLVEGSIGGGYEWGLETAIHTAEQLTSLHQLQVEVMVAGRVSEGLKREWKGKTSVEVNFVGQVPAAVIPELDRSAHLLYAADINTACPNSVIEALACGLPVAAFNTGALPELVTADSGKLVDYGGDPWKLETPDVAGLAEAVYSIYREQARFRVGARRRAEEAFGLDRMVDGYLEALSL